MSTILMRCTLEEGESELLTKEFPHHNIRHFADINTPIDEKIWRDTEIYFGHALSGAELLQAPLLRWVHCPYPYGDALCLHDLWKRECIIVTNTKGQHLAQTGEFAIGAMLAFAKQSFHWVRDPHTRPTRPIWKLQGKTLLQIGLGIVGTEIARLGKQLGLKVIGIRRTPSFHPYCEKVHPYTELLRLLPHADIVSMNLLRGQHHDTMMSKREIDLMKDDSIFLTLGGFRGVDPVAIEQAARSDKLRGVVLDFYHSPVPAKNAPIWSLPNVLIAPGVAGEPRSHDGLAFRTFRYNLRQFLHGNYMEMRNTIESEIPV